MFLTELHSPWGFFQSGNTVPGRNYPAYLEDVSKIANIDTFTKSWE